MNYYDYSIKELVRSLGFPTDRKQWLRRVNGLLWQMSRDPEMLDRVRGSLPEQDRDNATVKLAILNYGTQVLWEITALFNKTVVYVEDVDLLDALMRSDVDAMIQDVRMPFPVMEFVFPESARMLDGVYRLSGTLMCDLSFLERFWGEDVRKVSMTMNKAGFQLQSRLLRADGSPDSDGISWIRFGADMKLDDLPQWVHVAEDDRAAIRTLSRLCVSLCLYCQTKEGQRAIVPCASKKRQTIPEMGKAIRKRPSRRITSLLPPALRLRELSQSVGHHARPVPHWRRGHMRSLRHERYARNPDGSVHVVWVHPAPIAANADTVTAERKV